MRCPTMGGEGPSKQAPPIPAPQAKTSGAGDAAGPNSTVHARAEAAAGGALPERL